MLPWSRSRLLLVLCACLLAGCASTPSPGGGSGNATAGQSGSHAAQRADPRALLEQARRATGPEANHLRMQAAMRYAEMGDYVTVGGLIESLADSALDADDQFRRQLLIAALALDAGDAARALSILDALPGDRYGSALDADELVLATTLRARAFEAGGRTLAAARERIFLDGLLDPDQRTDNRRRIWALLVSEPADAIDALLQRSRGERELTGWLELARIARGIYPTLEAQQADVALWRARWSDHPAARAMPERLARLPRLIADRPRHIALLLPLSGPLAPAGRAVRDGFMAAHLQALAAGGATPQVTLVDTATTAPAAAYRQAVDAGAELVVGPLSKEAVDAIAALDPTEVPVLALNTTSPGVSPAPDARLIQFALLPEDDGVQIAQRMHADGLQRALLLMREAPWAERMQKAFSDEFRRLGGTVVETRRFATTGGIGQAVSSALLIDESEDRARDMRRLVASNLEFEPRRRQDIDSVVLIADPASGRTLKPALDYYFAGDLPVYASSHVHDARATAEQNATLDGIRFCDMPWRLLALPARTQVEAAWPEGDDGAASFHALGFDAWRLHAELGDLARQAAPAPTESPMVAAAPVAPVPDLHFSGVTGELTLAPDGRLHRDLQWAVMQDGKAVPLPRMAIEPATSARQRVSAAPAPATEVAAGG